MSRIRLIANPFSGTPQGRLGPEGVAEEIRSAGHDVEITLTEGPKHATELAATGAATCDMVVALGGDGTVHEVACGLVGTGCSMGVLAAGSGNDFARGIGCSTQPEGLAAILHGRDAVVDACSLDGHTFVNSLALLGSGLVSNRAATLWRWLGGTRYVLAAVKTLLNYRGQDVRWTFTEGANETVLEDRFFFAEICNGPMTGGGFRFAPDAVLDDGRMDVCLIRPMNPLTGLRLLPAASRGDRMEHDRIDLVTCAELTFTCGESVGYHLDGEAGYLEPGTHVVRMLEEKLTVRVPADWKFHG